MILSLYSVQKNEYNNKLRCDFSDAYEIDLNISECKILSMGHRFSKISPSSSNANKTAKRNSTNTETEKTNTTSERICITQQVVGSVGNSTKQESPTIFSKNLAIDNSSSSSLTSVNNSGARQIIIKIQLAKMENENGSGNGNDVAGQIQDTYANRGMDQGRDTNSNRLETDTQIFNVTLNRSFVCGELADSLTPLTNRTAGSSLPENNNNTQNMTTSHVHSNLISRLDAIQVHDDLSQSQSELPEYCEVLEGTVAVDNQSDVSHVCGEENEAESSKCRCTMKTNSSSYLSKRRCCKCTCRDALKRLLDTSSKSTKNKERKEQKHSSKVEQTVRPLPVQPDTQNNSNSQTSTSNTTSIAATGIPVGNATLPSANQVAIWTPNRSGDVIIPISAPHVVVVQCPPTSMLTLAPIDDNAIRVMTTGLMGNGGLEGNSSLNTIVKSSLTAPIVHSQVDFVHCLVPDLEKIINASFYWGKIDRYEAERLLEGKPEGTFLLRDSAQEEFLFSVTFRIYGRSLHARVEQSGHKFSFDCHDPGVFTASTVTGLLEHYKDPSCVMFFEPMLTIPLHRKTTFSLQQLCRATIVSHITYDGINELELPARLKSYLKEYHYKQKVRVKPFESYFYSRT